VPEPRALLLVPENAFLHRVRVFNLRLCRTSGGDGP
jgi:hypothetical protein